MLSFVDQTLSSRNLTTNSISSRVHEECGYMTLVSPFRHSILVLVERTGSAKIGAQATTPTGGELSKIPGADQLAG